MRIPGFDTGRVARRSPCGWPGRRRRRPAGCAPRRSPTSQTKSTDTDVVTAADRAVERQVVEALRAERPGDGVLGEEYGDSARYGPARCAGSSTRSTAPSTTSTACRSTRSRWPPRWTAWWWPAWWSTRRPATSGRRPAAAAPGGTGGGCSCSGGPSWARRWSAPASATTPRRRAHQGAVLAGLITRVRDIRRFGAAALDLCLAAEGTLDAYFEKGLNPWDHAAGGLIAAEAGADRGRPARRPAGPGHGGGGPAGALRRRCTTLLVELDAAGGAVTVGRCSSSFFGRLEAGARRQVGSPTSTSDWLTSVVVASCWNWLPITMSMTAPLRLALYAIVGLGQEVRPQQLGLADGVRPEADLGDALELGLALAGLLHGEAPVLELVGDARPPARRVLVPLYTLMVTSPGRPGGSRRPAGRRRGSSCRPPRRPGCRGPAR